MRALLILGPVWGGEGADEKAPKGSLQAMDGE